MTSIAIVIINIDDVDDNPPLFHQLVYEGHVTEYSVDDGVEKINKPVFMVSSILFNVLGVSQ
jgi:hypothetical protein